ncbi:MAG: MmgE/PrpD family protein [Alphaproteobacteria bacterium]
MTTAAQIPNADIAARFIAASPGRNDPPDVIEAARMALVDTISVAIGACGLKEDAGETVRRVADAWQSTGRARILGGATAAPAIAALINATYGHCLDYDDTHVGAVAHLGNPTWAAALAVGQHLGANDRDVLNAFITGFEVGAKLGYDFGGIANEHGFHSTGIFGCLAATATAAVLMGLDEDGIRNALGAAATQAAGLAESFGTMSKPFHAGKAAMNGVLSAELAAQGFVAKQSLLESEGGIGAAAVQDGSAKIKMIDFDGPLEITRNTLKPYASCLLTHPVIDAARSLSEAAKGRAIAGIEIEVHPACIQLAGKPDPQTGLEGKFSTAYCAALGLHGYPVSAADFTATRVSDETLRETLRLVTLSPAPGRVLTSANMRMTFADGEVLDAETALARGNPDNPMTWDDMRAKFMPLVEPVLGDRAGELYDMLRNFGDGESMDSIAELMASA